METVYSALKPTGKLTIGNYLGAIKNMLELTKSYDCIYTVADLHSITVNITPAVLRENSLDMFSLLIALGLDPDKCLLFVQSQVPMHSELAWILNCYTQFGEARRMTQFKDKSAKAPENVNVGLFAYPVLMAADILLYQAAYVPIGEDQRQHLELARTIAERFNNRYSPTFVVPEGIFPKVGAKVKSLIDPTAKMGKTDENADGTVFLLDDKDTIMRKFKRAVTDSGAEIVYSDDKPGISNLITIYSAFTGKSIEEVQKEFEGGNYASFKLAVGETVASFLASVQAEYKRIRSDKAYLAELMQKGAESAAYRAQKTLNKVMRKVGFVQL
ncbi:MAG: tryptophan--tRNA ligase [Clostridiales bacterium]|nr:tryptophan--tRNA ligase [Clostridiales bacterium]